MTNFIAKVTQEFKGVLDNEVYPRIIVVGEEINGSLAETAIEAGWAKETKESKTLRAAAEDALTQSQAALKQADAEAQAIIVKREEDIAKLALLTHAELVNLADGNKIDISGMVAESQIIEALQAGLAASKIEIPAPAPAPAPLTTASTLTTQAATAGKAA